MEGRSRSVSRPPTSTTSIQRSRTRGPCSMRTCARLMNHPDKPPPEGLRLVPEVAAAFPRVSSDGKTYTFTLRSGFRFSDGTPVHATAFAHAINRILTKGIDSPAEHTCRTSSAPVPFGPVRASPLQASSRTGIISSSDSHGRTSTSPNRRRCLSSAQCRRRFPRPRGGPELRGSGPYFISDYVPNQRIVLERNRFYGGTRPHHVDRYVVDLREKTPQDVFRQIERGQADWGWVSPVPLLRPDVRADRKYGVNRSQFFIKPGLALRGYYLNVSRPLFHDNLPLRRAVNFAVDRPAIVSQGALQPARRPTDRPVPAPSMPGFRTPPLPTRRARTGQGESAGARPLARRQGRAGDTRFCSGTCGRPDREAEPARGRARRRYRGTASEAFFREAAKPDAPFDFAVGNWVADFVDPYQYINVLFDGRSILGINIAHFDLPNTTR